MTYVVTGSCINCKHTDCVSVCPVSCFYEGQNFVVINPEECIDCGLCEPECPVKAIMTEDAVPPESQSYIALNRELSAIWPIITRTKAPLPDAEHWAKVETKHHLLER